MTSFLISPHIISLDFHQWDLWMKTLEVLIIFLLTNR